MHCTALHCTELHYYFLHCTAFHCTAPHYTAVNCTALHGLLQPVHPHCETDLSLGQGLDGQEVQITGRHQVVGQPVGAVVDHLVQHLHVAIFTIYFRL